MRHYFLDTSALVKVYSVQAGSTRVQNIMRGANVRPKQNRIVISGAGKPALKPHPFELAPRQTFETMDLSEYDEDLVETKPRAKASTCTFRSAARSGRSPRRSG
ncbi:MAG TPA: hypothetical protein VGO40_06255 [Longimicrobium sp.]|nr:hypothetical protein [Longimicrobium sp.]